MNAMIAMSRVFGHLTDNNVVAAQQAVLSIEAKGSVLPSSVFERVLRAAVAAGELQPAYATFCVSAYGKAAFTKIVHEVLPRGA